MYYTSSPYATVRPAVYPAYPQPAYVVYEYEEPNILCSLTKVIFGGIGLIVTSVGAVCAASSEMIVSSCENKKRNQEHQRQHQHHH